MKKIYSKPSVSVVNVRLFGSILEKPTPGVIRPSIVTDGGDAKAIDDVVVEDDDDLGNTPMQTDWNVE